MKLSVTRAGLLVLALFACAPVPGNAQSTSNVQLDATPSVTVTTSAAQCVPPNIGSQSLFLFNVGSNAIWYRPIDGGGNPSAGGKGSVLISANTGWFWPAGSAPRNGLNCIAVGGSSDLTVQVGR